jgi:hypothetical protein
MKNALSCTAVIVVLCAAPALAGDGQVSSNQLAKLGLGGMKVMTDTQGMQVRGMSSNTQSDGLSLVFGVLTFSSPNGTVFVVGADTNRARATSENAGLNAVSFSQHSQRSAIALQLGPIVGPGGLQFLGFAIGGAGGNGTAFSF